MRISVTNPLRSRRVTPLLLAASCLAQPWLAGSVAAATCPTASHQIADIQGQTDISPLQGKVVTVQATVQALLYTDSKQPQVLLQDDSNAAIMVIETDFARIAKVGQRWALTGTVREIHQQTSLTNLSQSQHCGVGRVYPATTVQLPVTDLAQWERYEGLYLKFSQPLIVNDSHGLGRYGELTVADKRLWVSTEVAQPGDEARALEAQQQKHQLVIDDGIWRQNAEPIRFPSSGLSANHSIRVGDTLTQVEGFWVEQKPGYRLVLSKAPLHQVTNPRPQAPARAAADDLRVASFNVLNYFTAHDKNPRFPTKRGASNADELARQQAKMIAALVSLDADIIGLLEVENNGFAPGSAIQTLVQTLNKHSPHADYQWVEPKTSPGTDDIMVAMIYRSSKVTPIGQAATLTTGPFVRGSRPPLAQSFKHIASAQSLTVSINHFKSKGSCPKTASPDQDQGDGQACWNPTRVAAAKALSAWLKQNPTGVATEHRLIMGDLNAYRLEQPLQQLTHDGWQHLGGDKPQISYVFQGRSGSLDHALASAPLAAKLQRIVHLGINAEEPEVLDYNMEFKSKTAQARLFAPNEFRSSDHDPLLMDFRF